VQLAIDSLDRLVELVEERGGRVPAADAARELFALGTASDAVARSLLGPLVDDDARLAWRGAAVALAESDSPRLEQAVFCVFDLETTGLATASARICEIGAVRIEGLSIGDRFQTLVRPGVPLPRPIGALTGLPEPELAKAPKVAAALRRFTAFAGDAVLVAHNARFDTAFVNRELERLTGKRHAGPVIDTVPLARNLLRGRAERTSLAALSQFFGTVARPCHRALPDAEATAEILLRLIALAQERKALTLADLEELAAPRVRVVHGKRRLVRGAPQRPGVYLFRDRFGRVLYVGKARDLRARLRSYFGGGRQRPSVEAALGAAERIEWRVHGSELSAALEEVRLIRELRPPANARRPAPERYVYLARRGDEVVVTKAPTPYGPLRRRAHAERAARALRGCSEAEFANLLDGEPLPRLRARLGDLAECLRYEDAARLRDRIASLERVIARLRRLEELRRLSVRLVVPGVDPGTHEEFFLAGGRVHRDLLAACALGTSLDPDHLDELVVVGTFLERPPPELRVLPFLGQTDGVR
jgi:DNA polymerase III epsilon subunit family exonuclease